MSCSFTKQSLINNDRSLAPQVTLGYPLLITKDKFSRLHSKMIIDIISYDAFICEIIRAGFDKLDFYSTVCFKAANGETYNHWKRNKIIIQNAISIIYTGTASGSRQNDFSPIF